MSSLLTKKERKALDISAELWAAILEIEKENVQNKDDIHEHRRDIHDIQSRILARPAIREIFNDPKPQQ